MIEASHKKLEHAPPGADRHRLLAEAAKEVTPAIFFPLLVIAVAFLLVFALTGQAGRLFKAARVHQDVRHARRARRDRGVVDLRRHAVGGAWYLTTRAPAAERVWPAAEPAPAPG